MMSSTDYRIDRREMRFFLNEVLDVTAINRCKEFSDFNREIFEMIVEEAAVFAEKILAPINQNGDREGCLLEDGKVITPTGFKNAWKQFMEGGWIGLGMSPVFGGQGAPETLSTIVREILFGANQAFLITCTLTTGAANLIGQFGSVEQKALYCPKLATGEWTGTMCLTEPHAGSAVGDIKTTAVRQGSSYLIKGNKQFITSGDHDYTDNIVHLLLARTPDSPLGSKGISLFIVPKILPDGTKNDLKVVHLEHKMGIHGSPTCWMSFGENDQCHGYLLDAENVGMSQMFQMMNEARLFVGMQGLGASNAALNYAQAYANERFQGVAIDAGKNPDASRVLLSDHPDIRKTLMHMRSVTEGLRGLLYNCGFYIDMSSHGDQAQRSYYQDLVDIHIPIAKSFATDQGYEVATHAVQIFGGVGYTKDFPAEQNLRDIKIASIYEGTNGIQALDLVMRKFKIHQGRLLVSLRQLLETHDTAWNSGPLAVWSEEWKRYRVLMNESLDHLLILEKNRVLGVMPCMQKMFWISWVMSCVGFTCSNKLMLPIDPLPLLEQLIPRY